MSQNKKKDKRETEDFIPTELGSAIVANVAGRPTDEELMVADNPDPANNKMNKEERADEPITRG